MNEAVAPRLLDLFHRVLDGKHLEASEAEAAMAEIMAGRASEALIAGYLVALRLKGETAAEIAGSARAMRAAATPLAIEGEPLIDTCGTGGDASGTFNISTGAALVAAAAGATVAKHGNRSVSSNCGSADVLGALGIPVETAPERARDIAARHGFVFLFAPLYHGAVRHAMGPRQALAARTIFNAIGPLANPAGARRQVVGVYSADLLDRAAEALRLLGAERAFVVHSEDGLDEVSLAAPTTVVALEGGALRHSTLTPEDFGIERAPLAALAGGDAAENAARLNEIFDGARGPARDVVVVNAALALIVAGLADDPVAGARRAEAAIDAGAVRRLVDALRDETA